MVEFCECIYFIHFDITCINVIFFPPKCFLNPSSSSFSYVLHVRWRCNSRSRIETVERKIMEKMSCLFTLTTCAYKQKQLNKYKNYMNVSLIFLFSSSVLALFIKMRFFLYLFKIIRRERGATPQIFPPNPPMEYTPEEPYNVQVI